MREERNKCKGEKNMNLNSHLPHYCKSLQRGLWVMDDDTASLERAERRKKYTPKEEKKEGVVLLPASGL